MIAHPSAVRPRRESGHPRLAEVLHALVRRHGDRPLVGQRARTLRIDPDTGETTALLGGFTTVSGAQLWARVSAVAAALHRSPHRPVRPGDFVVTLGPATVDHLTVDLVCGYAGSVAVPLPHDTDADNLAAILTRVRPAVVAAHVDELDMATEVLIDSFLPHHIVVLDYDLRLSGHRESLDIAQRRLGAAPVMVTSLAELADRGSRLPAAPMSTDGDDTRLAMVSYPSCAVVSEATLARMWASPPVSQQHSPFRCLDLIPLDHLAGRLPIMSALRSGGTSYFGTDVGVATILDELATVRPTGLGLVPGVVELLSRHHTALIEQSLAGGTDPVTARMRADRRLRDDVLGGRVTSAWVAGPPLPRELQQFIDHALGFPVVATDLLTRWTHG